MFDIENYYVDTSLFILFNLNSLECMLKLSGEEREVPYSFQISVL